MAVSAMLGESEGAMTEIDMLEAAERLANAVNILTRALLQISEIAGNLPDDRLVTRTGPNDAVARGLMVVTARQIAIKAMEDARTR